MVLIIRFLLHHSAACAEPILVGSAKVSAIAVTKYGDLRLLHPLATNVAAVDAEAGNWTTFFDVPRIAVVGSDKEMHNMGKVRPLVRKFGTTGMLLEMA
jgi:hypothetical protein